MVEGKLKEVMIVLSTLESAKTLEFDKQSEEFYLVIDLSKITSISAGIPVVLKATERIMEFCREEGEAGRLKSVVMLVGNDSMKRVMSQIVKMSPTVCPHHICKSLEDGREFAQDSYLLSKIEGKKRKR